MNNLGFTHEYLCSIWNTLIVHFLRQWMYGLNTADVEGDLTYYFEDIQNFCDYFGIDYPVVVL
jgi:hypothetical protein